MFMLRKLKCQFTEISLSLIYNYLVCPNLVFCSSVWGCASKTLLNQLNILQKGIISERRRELPLYSHMEKQNIITREILILAMWFMEHKIILFRCRTDILDKTTRPHNA